MKLDIKKLGKMEYGKVLDIQKKLLKARQENEIDDTLILVEHPPVLTLGIRAKEENIYVSDEFLKKHNVGKYKIGRGGDVTYHGPGQIVGYPILNLENQGKDIRRFIWNIEEVFIRLLDCEYGIKAEREEKKYTGVWVGDSKVTAIGIAVKKWVTMHGFAFNVNTNLDHFKWINACGLSERGVTSVSKLLGRAADFERLNNLVITYFCDVFGYDLREDKKNED